MNVPVSCFAYRLGAIHSASYVSADEISEVVSERTAFVMAPVRCSGSIGFCAPQV